MRFMMAQSDLAKSLGDLLPKTSREDLNIQNESIAPSLSERVARLSNYNEFDQADYLSAPLQESNHLEDFASRPRSAGSVASDFGTSIVRGTSAVGAGIASLGATLEPNNLVGAAVGGIGKLTGASTLEKVGNTLQQSTASQVATISSINQAVQDSTNSWFSLPTQASITQAANQTQDANEDNAAKYPNNPIHRVAADLWDTTKIYYKNPLAATDLATEQVPQLFMGLGVGKLAQATIKARALAKGILETSESVAATAALEKASTSLAGRLQLGSIVGQEAGGAINSTAQSILAMKQSDLEKSSPAFRNYVSQGYTKDQAQRFVALRGGELAGVLQAPIAFATGSIAAKFEAAPFKGAGAGQSIGKRILDASSKVGKEVAEELPQSAGGQFAQNVGVAETADENQDLAEGVGAAAAQGAVGAGLSAAGAQVPSAAVTGARITGKSAVVAGKASIPTAKAAYKVTKPVVKAAYKASKPVVKVAGKTAYQIGKTGVRIPFAIAKEVAASRRANSKDAVNVQKDETSTNEQFENTAQQVDEIFPESGNAAQSASQGQPDITTNDDGNINGNTGGGTEATSSNPVHALDSVFSEEGAKAVKDIADSKAPSAKKLVNAIRSLDTIPEDATEQRRALGIYAADLYGDLINEHNAINEQIQNSNGGDVTQLTKQSETIANLLNNPRAVNLVQQIDAQKVSDADWDTVVNNLPEATPENLQSEEVQNALLTIKNKSVDSPVDVSPEQYKYVLNHDTSLNPQQRKTLKTKQKVSTFLRNRNSVRENILNKSRTNFQSAAEFVDNIFTFLRNGDLKEAQDETKFFKDFTEKEVSRAYAHDTVANEIATGKRKTSDTTVNGYYQLDANGKIDKSKTQFVNIHSKKGRQNLQDIYDDSSSLAGMYNTIAEAYPELNTSTVETFKPSFNTGSDVEKQNTNVNENEDENVEDTQDEQNTSQVVDEEPEPDTTAKSEEETQEESGAPLSNQVEESTSEQRNDIGRGEGANSEDGQNAVSVEPTTKGLADKVKSELIQLPEALAKATTAEEESSRTNQLLASFTVSDSKTNMTPNFLSDLRDSYSDIPDEVEALIDPIAQFTTEMKQGVADYIEDVQTAYDWLQSRLKRIAKDKNYAESFTDGGEFPAWATKNLKVLYATRANEEGELEYQPELAQALAFAGFNYMLNATNTLSSLSDEELAKALNIPLTDITPETREILANGGMPITGVINQIANSFENYAGLKLNPEHSRTYGKNISKSLAIEFISTMVENGVMKVTPLKNNGALRTRNLVRVLDNTGIENLRESLKNQIDISDKLLLPERKTHINIGEPNQDVPNKVNGKTLQEIPPKVKQSIKIQQNIPYYPNVPLIEMTNALIDNNRTDFAASGYQVIDSQDKVLFNKTHLASIEGKNIGIAAAAKAFDVHLQNMEDYANANGLKLADVPAYFNFTMDTNGRERMLAAHNTQSNKYWRERMSVGKVTLNFDNDSQMREFYLHLAQALDIKVDKNDNDKSIAKVEDMILGELPELPDEPTPEQVAKFNEASDFQVALATMVKGFDEGFDNWTPEDKENIRNAVFDKGEKYLHGLHQAGKYLSALGNGENSITHYLTYELDGVTDGPANSIINLVMTGVSEPILNTLQKVGWLVNRPDTTSNQVYDELPDIYTSVAEATTKLVNSMRGNQNSATQLKLKSYMRLLHFSGYTNTTSDSANNSTLGLNRAFAKIIVTPTVYGSGSLSISKKIVLESLGAFSEHLTEILQGKQINDSFINSLKLLAPSERMGRELDKIQHGDVAALTNFRATSPEVDAMAEALNETLGKKIFNTINNETHSSLKMNKDLSKLTQIQSLFYTSAYRKAYKEKLALERKEGRLAKNEMLSLKQENEVLASVEKLSPTYLTGITGNKLKNGFAMAEIDRNSIADSDDIAAKARSTNLEGKLKNSANYTQIVQPGVRMVPLLNIAAGDASMMCNYFVDNPDSVSANVYDGLETKLGDMSRASDAINDSVRKVWSQNVLINVAQGFKTASKLFEPLESLDSTAIEDLGNIVVGPQRSQALAPDALLKAIKETIDTLPKKVMERGKLNRAARLALLETKSNISHMGGYNEPYVTGSREYTTLNTKDLAQAIQERAHAYHQQAETPVTPKQDNELLKAISSRATSKNGNIVLDANGIRSVLMKHKYNGNKYRIFLSKMLLKSIPSDVQLVIGTHENVNNLQAKLFPNVEPMLASQTGRQIGNFVFLTKVSEEVLLHEMLHTAVAGNITQYFSKNNNLSTGAKAAIKALDTLMDDFNNLSTQGADVSTINTLDIMQAQIDTNIAKGDRAAALNEFVAWTMSNADLNKFAASEKNTNPETNKLSGVFRKLFSGIRKWLAKILGIPNHAKNPSFLESITGQFDSAAYNDSESSVDEYTDNSVTQQTKFLAHDSESKFSNALTNVVTTLDENFIKPVLNPAERPNYSVAAEVGFDGKYENILAATDWFQAQGFKMNEQERHTFQLMQSFFHSGSQLNSVALNQMSKLYEHIVPNLSANDFLLNKNNPTELDKANATAMYNAIVKPSKFKDHQLANFVALAISNGHLRQALINKEIPKTQWLGKGSLDVKLNNFGNSLIQNLANTFINGSRKNNVNEQIEQLATKIATIQDSSRTSILHKLEMPLRSADAIVAKATNSFGKKAMDALSTRVEEGKTKSASDAVKNTGLMIASLATKDSQVIESIQTMVNSGKIWRPITQLVNEVIGTTPTNAAIMRLLQQAKNRVSAVRQVVKKEVPKTLASKFSRKLEEHEHVALRRVLGETDLQVLGSDMTLDSIKEILDNGLSLATGVANLRSKISNLPNGKHYVKYADALAKFMITKDTNEPHLLRNSYAIASLAGLDIKVDTPEQYAEQISQYITVAALAQLDKAHLSTVSNLIADERDGVDFMFNYLRGLATAERNKQSRYNRLNSYKGYIPESFTGSRKLVVVDTTRGADLVNKYGYTYLGRGGYSKSSGLGYYFTTQNLTSAYTQGAIQNVEPLVAGVDPLSGRSHDLKGSYLMNSKAAVSLRKRVTENVVSLNPSQRTTSQLLPIFNKDGNVVSYEAPISEEARQKYLTPENNFYDQIALWHSRATEETLAHSFNNDVAKALADMWTHAKSIDRKSFVDITQAAKENAVDKRTWESLPATVKQQLRNAFGDEPIMIRRDTLDNALGYADFSIGSVFTNETNLPKSVQKGIVDVATALLGKNAPRYLLAAERGQQDLVSLTKDWIIVRSVMVGWRNILSNFAQLKMNNIGYGTIFKGQLAKLKEVDDYMKNRNEIIKLKIDSTGNPSDEAVRKIQRLTEANGRMSIAPLIEAGELPTVAEGMTIEDDESVRHGLGGYIDSLFNKLPKGMSKAVQYATLAKNTPINSALNRMLTYSDLVAKAVVFDKLVKEDGYTTEQALQRIQDEFVNYDTNPGRTRTYLEKMGLTWFANYKLKIQKTNLRLLRDHPLATLVTQGAAGEIGLDTPLDANVVTGDNQHVFGTPFKALEIPSLHPIVQLLN